MPTPEEMAAQAADEQAKAQAAAAAAAQTTDPKPPLSEDPKVLRAELERARKEAGKYRTELRSLTDEKRKAEEAALAEQGKHKELAEARAKALEEKEKELTELRTFKAENEARANEERTKREAQVATEFAALPEEYRASVGADDLRSQEIAVNAYRVAQGQKPKPPSIPAAAPKPQGGIGAAPFTQDQIRVANQILGNPRAPAAKRAEAQAVLAKAKDWKKQNGG